MIQKTVKRSLRCEYKDRKQDITYAFAACYLAYKYDDKQTVWVDFKVLANDFNVSKEELAKAEEDILKTLDL